MSFKSTRQTAFLAVIAALIVISVLSAATFAWFTFSNDTNVTPLSGTVSRGEGSLLISASPAGPFEVSCALPLDHPENDLYPVSTADLASFYTPTLQADNGIVVLYRDSTEDAEQRILHGRVWLKAESAACNVYFWPASLSFGTDIQALAALRLGLRFTTAAGTRTYFFRLDEFGATDGAAAQRTVNMLGTVVSAVDERGAPIEVADPAVLTAPYRATVTEDDIVPGASALCALGADEIGSVEYWLYLEGCDENCINVVQSRDIALQLGFAGVQQ